MANSKRSVLITGCSDGGLGAALAIAFHEAGLHVYATARNLLKMKEVTSHGIETLELDVQSDASIAECVRRLPRLDILLNNAGGGYNMPVSDLSISEAKKIFDLNVWSHIAVTQAFLPLLLASKGMIVNQTSVLSVVAIPFQGAYCASKAAMAMLSESLRQELAPFGITVVDMKTGIVKSNFVNNQHEKTYSPLPTGSIYEPAKEAIEKSLRSEGAEALGAPAPSWAKQVTRDLLKNKPPPVVWRGTQAGTVRIGSFLPVGTLDKSFKKLTGLDVLEKKLAK